MEKLTVRQFADVLKALVEANLSKEQDDSVVYAVSLVSEPLMLKGEKEVQEKQTQKTPSGEAADYELYTSEINFDMNAKYEIYEAIMDTGKIQQADILKNIARDIAESIKGSDEPDLEFEDEDFNNCEEDDEDENRLFCSCLIKTILICAAIPAGLVALKKLHQR